MLRSSCRSASWPSPGGAGGTGDDPALAAEIVKYLDSNGALVAIPEFIVQDVKRSITTLARMTQGLRNLLMLAEVRLYQVKQLLTPNDAAVLYEAVLGQGRGSLVADGDAAKRREVRRLAPRSVRPVLSGPVTGLGWRRAVGRRNRSPESPLRRTIRSDLRDLSARSATRARQPRRDQC